MQALFRCLGGGASLVEDIARQGAWDMLMSPETYHTGIAVLTRVLRREVPACCVAASQEAVRVLLQRQAYQDIGAMTVFVELLDCTDFEHVTGQVLHVLQLHLQSKSVVLRRMAITSLVTLSARPQEAATLQGLLPAVVQRLQDDDCDVTVAALAVLGNMLCLEDRPMAVSIALQLVETLPPLFENESSCVRARSILLWRDAMEVAVSTHKEQMRRDVQRSLLPLFFHLHDRDDSVAQASRETLLGAAKFLKRRQLRKLLETEQTWRVSECLLVEDSSGAEEYLQQSLPYLQSPQEPLREAAVRFTALRGKVNDSSLSVSSLALQTLMILDAAVKEPPSAFRLQALCYRLRKAWRRRTLAPGAGWLAVLLELRAELIPGALHTDTTRAAGPALLPAARGPARHTTPCVVAPRRQLRCRAAKPRGKVKESFCLPCPLQGHPGLDRCPLSAALPFHGKGRLGHEA
ncbi:maestro heat-like repeat-containing protein family member 7 isoform X2 [Ciconia boyciana]|uniref:maestro heat-like repeat-containing protein family member 7 isoform X2 n=1 Tax=Ciconia boyciana TaxID=52775 RepID=UPI003B9E5755